MKAPAPHAYPILKRILAVSLLLGLLLIISGFMGLSMGSTAQNLGQILAVLSGHRSISDFVEHRVANPAAQGPAGRTGRGDPVSWGPRLSGIAAQSSG